MKTTTNHPLPWSVSYYHACTESWHPKSCPYVVDANGTTVCSMRQNTPHPGLYDRVGDLAAQTIVECVNATPEKIAETNEIQ